MRHIPEGDATHLLAIGTRKGLWLATSEDRAEWEVGGPHHRMTEVYAVAIDPRRLVGTTWQEPEQPPVAFPADASLERVWQFALTADPDVVYAGTQPSALFRSEYGGRTHALVEGLWKHPHREQWGAGHGGSSWQAGNTGIRAYFLPDPYPEFGQCVHEVVRHPDVPDRMFPQNHHGVCRSDRPTRAGRGRRCARACRTASGRP
ncbi:beta propeller repeat protein [Saccharothrix syringae]|uniref:hypothetical protein n=1 Tax=Saccharothrix syringae TaxID=103733 RepID=UPI00068B4717|nr:hypothetical protein [Saccharothrix syringae]